MEKPSVRVRLLDELVADIKSKPEGELVLKGLKSADLKSVMDDLLKSSANIPGLSITPDLIARIEVGKAFVKGSVEVDHSLVGKSSASLNIVFGNSPAQKNVIVTEKSDIYTNLSTRAAILIAAAGYNLEEEITNRLRNPQNSLLELFSEQLKKQNLVLEGFAASFSTNDEILILGFKCKKL